MELELRVYSCLCETSFFKINGIEAEYEDFGDKYDANDEDGEEYGCGDMCFFPRLPTSEIIAKYGISVDEYKEVCEKLEGALSFGCCSWCV